MDAKEAKSELNEIRMLINKWQDDTYPSCVARDFMSIDVSVVDKSIEALEKVSVLEAENAILKRKEVPKVPENMFIEQELSASYIVKRNIRGFCPTCSSGLLLYNGVHRYCPFCSQKLDWPSDKE